MRLERQKPGRFHEREVTIGPHIVRMRPNVDFIHAYSQRSNRVFRHVTFRIKLDAQRHVGGGLFADRMQMELEVDLRSGLDQPARTLWKHVAALSDGILVEKD